MLQSSTTITIIKYTSNNDKNYSYKINMRENNKYDVRPATWSAELKLLYREGILYGTNKL